MELHIPILRKSIHVQFFAIMNYDMRYYNSPSNHVALCGSIGHKKATVMNFWTGIRSGELLALSVDNFDYKKCLLHITQNYCRFQGLDLLLTPKTAGSMRTISLPALLCDDIQIYMSSSPPAAAAKGCFP